MGIAILLAIKSHRRGQASVEYLMVSLFSLMLLAISLSALASIRASAEKNFDSWLFVSSVEKLSGAISDTCALGHGNSREINLPVKFSVVSKYSGADYIWLLKFSNGNLSIVKEFKCAVELDPDSIDSYASSLNVGSIKIRNNKGSITVGSDYQRTMK